MASASFLRPPAAAPPAHPHLRHQGDLRRRHPRHWVRHPGLGPDARTRCRHDSRRAGRARRRCTGVGKTMMDEMAYSINGENAHYGTPSNPCAPAASPAAPPVARPPPSLPVSPTSPRHRQLRQRQGARRLLRHLRPLPFTWTGLHADVQNRRWFARDLATLSCVTDVLMPPVRADASDAELRRPSHVIIPADYLKILGSMEDRTYEILNASAAKVFGNDTVVNNGNIGDFVSSNVPSIGKFMTDLSAVEASSSCVPSLSAISRVMRVLQWHVAFLSVVYIPTYSH
uniref:Uncharacterized protein n=2 Tax=Aegilops tauschii subsp. strangulata TaxID=200361 RepID=A0A453JV15_AEGTS|nr:amidase 1-like isoform X1 [Aegilops tauschii subsp. strangulata]